MGLMLRAIVVVLGVYPVLPALGKEAECHSATKQHGIMPSRSGVPSSEHVLLQFAGQLSRFKYADQYDAADIDTLPVRYGRDPLGTDVATLSDVDAAHKLAAEVAALQEAHPYEEGLIPASTPSVDGLGLGSLQDQPKTGQPAPFDNTAPWPGRFDLLDKSTEFEDPELLPTTMLRSSSQDSIVQTPTIPQSSSQDGILQTPMMAGLEMMGYQTGALSESSDPSCGFISASRPICGQMARHNCKNVTKDWAHLTRHCPPSCNSLLPDPLFSCEVACVAQQDCGKLGGRTMGYYDPLLQQCAPGPIAGCVQHSSRDFCVKCGKLFRRSVSGRACEFMPGYQYFATLVLFVVVVLLAILLPLNLYRWCCRRIGNRVALSAGWRRHSRVRASAATYADPTREHEPLPLSTNMHRDLVAGTGLCLFYNSLQFLFIVAISVAIVASLVWLMTSVPSLGAAGMCGLRNNQDFNAAVQDLTWFQMASAVLYLLLWIALFGASLRWAAVQHLNFRRLDADTSLMSDFGVQVTGLPPDAQKKEIELFFGKTEFVSNGIVGVSVAYDFTEHSDLVAKMLDGHMYAAENRVIRAGGGNPEEMEAVPQAQDHDTSDKYYEALETLSRLPGSGTAFVVCQTEGARDMLRDRWKEENPLFRGTMPVHLQTVYAEPTTFFWENFGYDRRAQLCRGLTEMIVLILEMLVLGFAVYWPAAYYIFYHLMATGEQDDSDPVIMILGYGIAIMNSIMYVLVDISSRRVGFHHKADVDMCNLIGCTIIVSVQTFFNLAISYYAVKSVDMSLSHSLLSHLSSSESALRQLSFQSFVAAKLWNLLIPGVLIVPDLVGRLFKYVLSIKALYHAWIYLPFIQKDLRTDKKLTKHIAEAKLLPSGMQTEFDYSNSICITSTAFVMLFFQSEYTYLTCWVLVIWVVMTYITLKICHLRFNMVVEYTSHYMDDCYNYLWGIPLSIVACASGYWFTVLLDLPSWVAAVFFGVSLIGYLVAVRVVIRRVSPADDSGKGTYDRARSALKYDYFNTNPVQVLKSRYLREGEPLTYFARGKEYLQRGHGWTHPKKRDNGLNKLFAYERDDSDNDSAGHPNDGCCGGSSAFDPLGESLKPSSLHLTSPMASPPTSPHGNNPHSRSTMQRHEEKWYT